MIKKIMFMLLLFIFLFSSSISSDTIVLKNGRKIHTSWIKIEGDKVTYKWTGGTMTISKKLIARIIEDDTAEPAKEETPESGSKPSETETTTVPRYAPSSSRKEKNEPKESGRYWAAEKKRLEEEKKRLEAEIDELENYRIALIRSRRSTTEIKQKIEAKKNRLSSIESDLSKLFDRARKNGVTEWDINHALEKMEEEGGSEEGSSQSQD